MKLKVDRRSAAWLAAWIALGLYFIVAAVGAGAGAYAALTMFCGFMVARNVADLVGS